MILETEELRLLPADPALAQQAADYYRRNRDFFAPLIRSPLIPSTRRSISAMRLPRLRRCGNSARAIAFLSSARRSRARSLA